MHCCDFGGGPCPPYWRNNLKLVGSQISDAQMPYPFLKSEIPADLRLRPTTRGIWVGHTTFAVRLSGRIEPFAQQERGDPQCRNGQRLPGSSNAGHQGDVEPDQREHARLHGPLDHGWLRRSKSPDDRQVDDGDNDAQHHNAFDGDGPLSGGRGIIPSQPVACRHQAEDCQVLEERARRQIPRVFPVSTSDRLIQVTPTTNNASEPAASHAAGPPIAAPGSIPSSRFSPRQAPITSGPEHGPLQARRRRPGRKRPGPGRRPELAIEPESAASNGPSHQRDPAEPGGEPSRNPARRQRPARSFAQGRSRSRTRR